MRLLQKRGVGSCDGPLAAADRLLEARVPLGQLARGGLRKPADGGQPNPSCAALCTREGAISQDFYIFREALSRILA